MNEPQQQRQQHQETLISFLQADKSFRCFCVSTFFLFIFLLTPPALLSAAENEKNVAVVTSRIFLPALDRWITYRESQGYKIRLLIQEPRKDAKISLFQGVSPLPVPLEIRSQIVEQNRKTPLSAILIIGDGAPLAGQSSDPRDPLGSALNVIQAPRTPAKVINRFGTEEHIAADSWYADLDEDGFPDIPIGRIPARTPKQLEDAVNKILYYEQVAPTGVWQRRAALIAGLAGFSPILDNVINNAVRQLLSSALPIEYDWTLVQANWKSPYCPDPFLFRYTVIDELNKGPLFWVYMGHGLHQELDRLVTPEGNYKILELSDLKYVNCESTLPIMLFCACYTGAYDSTEPSMAEEFVLAPKGPIAVIASSRTSMPYGMAVFGVEFLEEIFDRHEIPGELTLGEYILAAKRRMRSIKPAEKENEGKESETVTELPDEKADFFAAETETETEQEDVPEKSEEPEEETYSSLRKSLDGLAQTFDPTSSKLDDQLEDHRNLFNLFGDPLLRIRFPKPIRFTVPETGILGETITVSSDDSESIRGMESWSADEPETAAEEGNVLVELIRLPTRPNTKGFSRKKYSDSDAGRIEFQRTYEQANNRVLASASSPLRNGKWNAELPMTAERTGSYIVRVMVTTPNETYIGAKRIKIRNE